MPVNSMPVLWNDGNYREWNWLAGHVSFCPFRIFLYCLQCGKQLDHPWLRMASSKAIPPKNMMQNSSLAGWTSAVSTALLWGCLVIVHSQGKGSQQGSISLLHISGFHPAVHNKAPGVFFIILNSGHSFKDSSTCFIFCCEGQGRLLFEGETSLPSVKVSIVNLHRGMLYSHFHFGGIHVHIALGLFNNCVLSHSHVCDSL